ncbi:MULTISPECIES: NAD(P)H-quinone dehydrogenase [Micromonospora]|uniref:NAD(P)H-quinone dehydrogenase n=1 Tax=Micromonospora TaxID=1873 RepID=UPI0003EEC056|nr:MULTISPECIES: NAD(P)H-quinone dehydrogenase [Micromonospora]EWM66006.1 alpha keto acid dehydrogenase complex, E3 component, lipoamide dehydrogenase [Micromonospora sp. M42]MBC8989202.1 NAD(P)H-quinone dehydrogenase [Micromonospora chalcea]MBP1780900.1 dihydrolipoamide dehydrogenase [Micromonospora sp. HB375]MBQ1061107.1 NAD(P)H-quinone dehydrogenase [Micromonospora sp. C41]MBQ1068955.1 NAD(P)H-quinone dehydrogenase [Micromonospora sp. D75]
MSQIVIIGGGPAGYEAALVAAQLDAEVTVVEAEGAGGACVLSDCVPSKTFIASSEVVTGYRDTEEFGVHSDGLEAVTVDARAVHERVKRLALAQSADIHTKLVKAGVEFVAGTARLGEDTLGHTHRVIVTPAGGGEEYSIAASTVLVATGATPRQLPTAVPDGERILTWRQVYDLPDLPEHLIVVGSGVTGAEFASAYLAMGVKVTLVSSRDRVMPHEDADAAMAIERVFRNRGMSILNNSRAEAVRRVGDGVEVVLSDGRQVTGSHALIAVGSIPNTADLGLAEYGVELARGGYVTVDRVSRTNVPGIYAAGDCTGVLPLASVAAMQGRIAMWHALGEAVRPLRLRTVAANVFTDPELATVGVSQDEVDAGKTPARQVMLPLSGNARAKMDDLADGFVKLFCRPASGQVIGGVVVAPKASELILPITMAVENNLTVNELAHTITIYPSLSGSITEAARQLMLHELE